MTSKPETATAPPVAETPNSGLLQSPYCRELRSKKYFFLQEMPTEAHQYLDTTGVCWCSKTMQVIGPDGERALPRQCNASRPCYRSFFEE